MFLPVLSEVAGVVEHVVDQLERGAEVHAVAASASSSASVPPPMTAPSRRRGLEQLGGLVADDAQVVLFVDVGVVAVEQLQHFAFGDGVGGVGQDSA